MPRSGYQLHSDIGYRTSPNFRRCVRWFGIVCGVLAVGLATWEGWGHEIAVNKIGQAHLIRFWFGNVHWRTVATPFINLGIGLVVGGLSWVVPMFHREIKDCIGIIIKGIANVVWRDFRKNRTR